MTREQFQAKLDKLGKHIVAETGYQINKDRVNFRCKTCGYEWNTAVSNVLYGCGCPMCGRKRSAQKNKKSNEQFLQELRTINSFVVPITPYTKATDPIECACTKCGHTWTTKPTYLLSGRGCPECAKTKISDSKKLSVELFLERFKINSDKFEIIGEYSGVSKPLKLRCKICNHEWTTMAKQALKNQSCPICAIKRRGEANSLGMEAFTKRVKEKFPDIEVSGDYINQHSVLHFKCLICGMEWDCVAKTFINGCGCTRCFFEKYYDSCSMSHDEFMRRLDDSNPDIEPLERYRRMKTKMKFKCRKCGNVWSTIPYIVLIGCSCPACMKRKSHGEKRIERYLESQKINFDVQKKFDGLTGINGGRLSYDFYLPDHNLLIEYQGEYHDGSVSLQTMDNFWTQVENDQRKRDYAEQNNYNLLEIWYYDFNSIETILSKRFQNSL